MSANHPDHDLLVRIDERVGGIKDDVAGLKQSLFGNGQPGLLSAMKKRIRRLEWFAGAVAGGATVVGWLFRDRIIGLLGIG